MSSNSPPGGRKRSYRETEPLSQAPDDHHEENPNASPLLNSAAAAASAFRNVSACNRCRLRKNRCDQRLPACTPCEKAKQRCVGYDPITKREIPRSFVYYLETRLSYLESLLVANNVPFKPSDAFDPDSTIGDGGLTRSPAEEKAAAIGEGIKVESPEGRREPEESTDDKKEKDAEELDKLVSNIGMVSVQGASDPRYLGLGSGISFARVVFAAVKSSVAANAPERGGPRQGKLPGNTAAAGGSSMRDSFFGIQTKPTIKEAEFPDRELAEKLVDLYFEHANPQMPILHRVEFMALFDKAYAKEHSSRTPRELYLLNIVFAIGAGIIWGSSDRETESANQGPRGTASHFSKKAKTEGQQQQPEEYHAAAIVHLEAVLGSTSLGGKSDGAGSSLEELQAVLLLAGFALLRPVAPGLWYIIGVAVRLAVDLGLHYEDTSKMKAGGDPEALPATSQDVALGAATNAPKPRPLGPREKGRREWVQDLRRRLWWCVYSFDRLVSTCVGRPIGITDHVITTEFPSLLDDAFISKSGILADADEGRPSYKRISYHYFRLRLLQSEILQVLQHQQAQQVRSMGAIRRNQFMHTNLPSPFLLKYDSFWTWRNDIDRRLWEWKESAPKQQETGVKFMPDFLELNYWQAVVMLYRNSLTVPVPFVNELSPTEEVGSPSFASDEREDDDDVFLKVAEAGQNVLRLYRQLHRRRLVNYTYLATHHLFMAGIAFLYAVWHSPAVRSSLTLDDVDYTVLAATSVLKDLMEKCPPAEACKEAFERMSKATVQMCLSTTGFGSQGEQQSGHRLSMPGLHSYPSHESDSQNRSQTYQAQSQPKPASRRPPPRFDYNLRDLFPEGPPQNLPLTSTALQDFDMNMNDTSFESRNQIPQYLSQSVSPQQQSSSLGGNASPLGQQLSHASSQQLPSQRQNSAQYFYPQAQQDPQDPSSMSNFQRSGLSGDNMEYDLSSGNQKNTNFDPLSLATTTGNLDDFGMSDIGGIDWGFTGGGLGNTGYAGNTAAGGSGSLGGSSSSPNSYNAQAWNDANGFGVDLFDGFFFGGQ